MTTERLAQSGASLFIQGPAKVTFVQHSENPIYAVDADSRYFLRLVSTTRRTKSQVDAELAESQEQAANSHAWLLIG
jgi:hypothetical protein